MSLLMNLPEVQTNTDVSEDKVAVLANLAHNLSIQNDDVIQTLVASGILNPDVQKVLASEDTRLLLGDETSMGATSETTYDVDFGLLAFPVEQAAVADLWPRMKSLFIKLRKKVRHVFCQVVDGLRTDQDLNLKQIIKDVLLVLIPSFAGATGLMPIALPIVVSLAALLLKYGVDEVCPL